MFCVKKISGVLTRFTAMRKYGLSVDNINPYIKNIEYDILGPLVMRALEIKDELESGTEKGFKEVLLCTAGDNQAGGQLPNTFLRQILALCSHPHLFDDKTIPSDAKERAKHILKGCAGHTIGSYGHPAGMSSIRADCVKYIKRRDNLEATVDNLFLTTGASEGMDYMMHIVSSAVDGNKRGGVMLPVPVYPLYLAYNLRYNNYSIKYYLDEANNWRLNERELERSFEEGSNYSIPKLIVAINPGNPTGSLFTRSDIETVIDFAKRNNLTIIADEVYQDNVYGNNKFISFKRVLHDLGPDYDNVELVSLMSVSKGIFGECGLRGGYMELVNINPIVRNMLLKNLSLRTCAPIIGQVAMNVLANPPKKGEESYELFTKEIHDIFQEMENKAKLISEGLNKIPGYSVNEIKGAIYAFPKIYLPDKAVQEAEKNGVAPDAFYCRLLLENTGVCIIPGSAFQQKPGTHHVRLTMSPSFEKLSKVIEIIKRFQETFIEDYR